MRRVALMAYDRDTLRDRMKAYFDKKTDLDTFAALGNGPLERGGHASIRRSRARKLIKVETFDEAVKRYSLYPLDTRWCYYSAAAALERTPPRTGIAARG